MSEFPDFSNYGYQVTRELGHNRAGGRVTYLATEINTNRSAVVKQFQFARTATNWSEYQAYEREIQVLRELDHPSIPRYLDSFQTPAGFCMVQEYKNAPSLATPRQWKPQQVKQIAISILEILKYLQSRVPPVIHRDLKPENILVDDQMNVYLVDFGFARLGGGEVAASSVVKGTLGFMPPEQMFNRQLTPASDLYSLGATLICLLTGVNSTEVGRLMDEMGRVNFQGRLQQLSPEFIAWLQTMVEPNYKDRFASAEQAFEALIPINILRPERSSKSNLVTLGYIVAGIALFVPLGFQYLNQQKPVIPKATTPPIHLNPVSQVMFTEKLESAKNLDQISISSERIYFSVNLSNLPNLEYESVCQIFDGSGKQVARGQAILEASGNTLNTWCWHQFNPKTERPGNWKFEFSLNNQKIVQKTLKVIPINQN